MNQYHYDVCTVNMKLNSVPNKINMTFFHFESHCVLIGWCVRWSHARCFKHLYANLAGCMASYSVDRHESGIIWLANKCISKNEYLSTHGVLYQKFINTSWAEILFNLTTGVLTWSYLFLLVNKGSDSEFSKTVTNNKGQIWYFVFCQQG